MRSEKYARTQDHTTTLDSKSNTQHSPAHKSQERLPLLFNIVIKCEATSPIPALSIGILMREPIKPFVWIASPRSLPFPIHVMFWTESTYVEFAENSSKPLN